MPHLVDQDRKGRQHEEHGGLRLPGSLTLALSLASHLVGSVSCKAFANDAVPIGAIPCFAQLFFHFEADLPSKKALICREMS